VQYKSAAQGLITLATYGLGMLVGFKVAGIIYDQYALATGHDWKAIWIWPAVFAAGVMLLFAVAFRSESIRK
jgi:MFS family permease